MTKVDLHKVLVIYIASTKSMPITWGLFWIFVFYLSSILTIIGFLFQLSHLFNSNHIVFSKNSRKATLGKITRSSPLFSKFYNSVSFVDEGVKLKPLFFRTYHFILLFIIYLIVVFICKVTQGIVTGILSLLISSSVSLFFIVYYYLVDDFSQFLLTEHKKHIFTVLKPQIQEFSVSLSQDLFLITFVWFYLLIGIFAIIGPSNFLSYVTSNPIVPVALLGIELLISVFLTHEFNDKKDYLVSWAFEKYREEENLRLPVRIEIIDKNGFKEVISGFLQGIDQNIAILLDDGMIQEIPWKKIGNIIIGAGAILREEKCTTMQQFFDDLIGKSLTIYNKLKVTKYMITT